MEAKSLRKVASGQRFNQFFPAAKRTDPIIKQDAGVEDTISLIKKVVGSTLDDTRKIAKVLKGKTVEDTCRRIWHFVYQHIRYTKDKDGVEQVRRPARSWEDRFAGVDCDCYSTFISSILTNLGISHALRITEYAHKGFFQHVYPIVIVNQARYKANQKDRSSYIVIDCVLDRYNEEEPFTKHKDYTMELAYLNGTDGTSTNGLGSYDDFTLMVDGLGRVRVAKRTGKRGKGVAVSPVTTTSSNKVAAAAPTEAAVTPSQIATATTASGNVTHNTGILKNGQKVELSTEVIPGTEYTVPYSGSQMGKVISDKKVLVNGQPANVGLSRFVVVNGMLRGVNTKGQYFANYGNGQGFIRIKGVRILNPGVALGTVDDETSAADWQPMLSITKTANGFGILSGTVPSVYGMWIDADVAAKMLALRPQAANATNGLEGLGMLLGDETLDAISRILPTQVNPMSDLQADGWDDMNGICGILGDTSYEFAGFEGLNAPVDGAEDIEYINVFDGLGNLGRARVRRSPRARAASRKAAPAAAPAATPNAAAVGQKTIGFYIPLNTLNNLLKLRLANINRLRANGHKIVDTLPASVSGFDVAGLHLGAINGQPLAASSALAEIIGYAQGPELNVSGLSGNSGGLGFFDQIGKFFQNPVKSIADTVKHYTSEIQKNPILNTAANLIPGVGVGVQAASAVSNFVSPPDAPSGGGSQPSNTTAIPVSQLTNGQTAPAQVPANAVSYEQMFEREAQEAYNREVSGLGNTTTTAGGIIGLVKENPVTSGVIAATLLGGTIWALGGFDSPKGRSLGGVKKRKDNYSKRTKKSGKRKASKRTYYAAQMS